MATLRELIYAVHEEITGFDITDDSPYPYPYLKSKVLSVRNTMINDVFVNKLSLSPYYSIMDCIEVECFKHECKAGGITIIDDRPVWVIRNLVLHPTVGREAIQYLGVAGYEKGFSWVTMTEFLMAKHSQWAKNLPMLTQVGNDFIMKNPPSSGFRFLFGILLLSDPTKACNWPADDNYPLPLPADIKLGLLVKKDIMFSGKPDLLTDAQRTLGQQTQAQSPQESNDQQNG